MIYIKTKLKKIPDACNKCQFSENVGGWGNYERVCVVSGNKTCPMERTENHNMAYVRPDWCPLVEESEA